MVENHSSYWQYDKAKALDVINITITNIIWLSPNILQGIQYFGLYSPQHQPCDYLCLNPHKMKRLTWFSAVTLQNSLMQPHFEMVAVFVSKWDTFVLQLMNMWTLGKLEASSCCNKNIDFHKYWACKSNVAWEISFQMTF